MRQQRLLDRLHPFRNERAAVPVRSSDEACSHVVAEKRNGGGMGAIGDRQRSAGVAFVLRITECRVGTEGNLGKIPAPRQDGRGAGFDAAATHHRRVGDFEVPANKAAGKIVARVTADQSDGRCSAARY